MSNRPSEMHIAMISSGFYTGGFTSSLFSMSRALLSRGIHLDYYLFDIKTAKQLPFHENVSVHEIKPVNQIFSRLGYKARCLQKRSLVYRRMGGMPLRQISLLNQVVSSYEVLDLSQYDAVISWEELTCNYYLAERVIARKKIGYVHPDYMAAGYNPEIDLPIYSKLDCLISVSENSTKHLKQVFPQLSSRIFCIPNLLDQSRVLALSMEKPSDLYEKSDFDIVTVCRLENRSKALDRAVRIAGRLEKEGLAFHWLVIGDGPDFNSLKQQAADLGVSKIEFICKRENPYPYIRQADLFVLQSSYEGRPVAVEEALCLHIPVLITDYSSASEQVQDSSNGWIVPNDEESICQKLRELIAHPEMLSSIHPELLSNQGIPSDLLLLNLIKQGH